MPDISTSAIATDDTVVLTPVVSLPGDVTLTVDTSVLTGGIATDLVQALVPSGDVVPSPPRPRHLLLSLPR